MPLYDNINPRTVKLWTLDILKWMAQGGGEPTVKDISIRFNIPIREAYLRVTRLRGWGVINTKKRTKPKTYIVSSWGFKFLEDKAGETNKNRDGLPSQPGED